MHDTVVISDTSCLIALTKIDKIIILHQMYEEVIVTEEIAREFGEMLPVWMHILQVKNKKYQQLLEATLDIGESSAIALAIEMKDALLIIDETKGRKEAKRLGLRITGTLGVLLKAKQRGFVQNLKFLLDELEIKGFRISAEVRNEILKEANEK